MGRLIGETLIQHIRGFQLHPGLTRIDQFFVKSTRRLKYFIFGPPDLRRIDRPTEYPSLPLTQ